MKKLSILSIILIVLIFLSTTFFVVAYVTKEPTSYSYYDENEGNWINRYSEGWVWCYPDNYGLCLYVRAQREMAVDWRWMFAVCTIDEVQFLLYDTDPDTPDRYLSIRSVSCELPTGY